ncbi:Fe-S cluster assembly protein SufD [Pseudanabaena galeata UHCC 0370]|uniref:Fe-S cluster assembly protein SufD n=1 Tax=Pseudanabaena galeata UHCC 0370 TaxID=3110310 RepID=A0ABU5TNH0_9CYAN|nr:Fe-S cluster assembly protein SufD [Pseudanabaena galeata]MEA5479887.1 Fe-S cluster assembly protein SufD [Pseudanabaena galeata UHCC 0370]
MAIQVSEQLEDQVEFKGALSTRSKLAVNSEQFVAQVVALSSDIASTDKETSDFVGKLRQLASDRLEALAFPTTKDEEWKYTDVSALGSLTFANQQAIASRSANLEALIANNIAPESLGNCLVFVNGKYRKDLSDASDVTEGLVIGTLATLGDRILPKLRSHLAQHPDANDYFASLNTACMEDVAIILAPKNLVVENPVQLIFISAPQVGASTLITQPRCLVIAESHSELTFVQTFVGENNQAYFTNAVTEVWLAEGAQVNHTKVQRQGNEAIHINTTAIAQAKNSVYKNQSISFGAKISRQNLIVQQMAAQTETSLTGLAFLDGEQLADTHSVISHNYPHGSSKQLHKCIADGRSHVVFNGKIQVAKLAQQTDSAQLSRNLLLSGKARVDTKPQLEIFADNVKCAHGATISQLDADEIFYLQSRAIDAESAANLLTYAFATEAISQIPVISIQRSLSNFVLEKTKA